MGKDKVQFLDKKLFCEKERGIKRNINVAKIENVFLSHTLRDVNQVLTKNSCWIQVCFRDVCKKALLSYTHYPVMRMGLLFTKNPSFYIKSLMHFCDYCEGK